MVINQFFDNQFDNQIFFIDNLCDPKKSRNNLPGSYKKK